MATSDDSGVVEQPSDQNPNPNPSIAAGDELITVDPEQLANQRTDIVYATVSEFDPFISDLAAFGSATVFPEKGKLACETASQAIRTALVQERPDPKIDLKCLLALDASCRLIKDYASVNFDHLKNVLSAISLLNEYVNDWSRSRPLNFMLLASPGSGKSHLVKCFAKAVGDKLGPVVEFNMATMETKRDLVGVLNECRNIIVDRKMPIAFLDEFDADVKNYATLLPLLWDGELHFENRPLKVGRGVFVLAGSSKEIPHRLKEIQKCAMQPDMKSTPEGESPEAEKGRKRKNRRKRASTGKIIDLLSRINGPVIDIPPYDMTGEIQPDKVVVAIARLRSRFPKCQKVPVALLKFISRAAFRHSSRSIQTLINEIRRLPIVPPEEQDSITFDQVRDIGLETELGVQASPLAYHLKHEHEVEGVCKLWNECLQTTHLQRIYSDHLKLDKYDFTSLQKAVKSIAEEELAPNPLSLPMTSIPNAG